MNSQASIIAPARRVLDSAIATNDALGHDNLGSLSYSHGFLPRQQPIHQFPSSHHAWDQIAAEIPYLFRMFAVRRAVADLPVLSALPTDLPDEYVLRASSLFSILAHVYWYSDPEPPADGIPPQIQLPWEQITKRLDRPAPHLSFIDLNSHNWLFIDPKASQPFASENLRLAVPMIGNEDERRFQTVPVEMLYQFSPLMDVLLRAQEAVLKDDSAELESALITISAALKFQTFNTLMKVNPNPYSGKLYINPVVWGKTAALFASPFQPANSVPGPSGTAIPSFTSLDIFFGRRRYHSTVGYQTDWTRKWFPKHWREWLDALEQVSVPAYVAQKADPHLTGIYEEVRDAYAGENGMLSRHRLKAYGFLDLSFKAGRVKTLGGTSGSYSERVWDRMATELEEARLERYGTIPQSTSHVMVKRVEPVSHPDREVVRRIVFDIANTGIRYQPGDRCGILPENSPALVEKTLEALRASGNEIIQLNAAWRWHINTRSGFHGMTELPLRTLLTFGRIRPVDRSAALNLYALTRQEALRRILDHWAEDQWELWDLLETLATGGYNPKRLWKGVVGDYEHICRIIPPERWRLYSISSVMDENPDELALTIGLLHYTTETSSISRGDDRLGTSSSFLSSLCESAPNSKIVSIKIVHPPRFSLPVDASRPMVMFAGGTGIAPMRGLIEARVREHAAGENWLFFGTRHRDEFYYASELEPLVAQGHLQVRAAFSRDDAALSFDQVEGHFAITPGERGYIDRVMGEEANARFLWEMLRPINAGGKGGFLYICGRTAFASTVLNALRTIMTRYVEGATEDERAHAAGELLYHLIGEDRLMLEIFTTYSGTHFDQRKSHFDISEVVMHNDTDHGYWMVISGRVYDMDVFNQMHPGGTKILQSYAGMDGTIAYQKIEHHTNSEVDAMLSMYELGVLRVPEFGQVWGIALSGKQMRVITLRDAFFAWVDVLYMIVEIENAIMSDFRVRNEPLTDAETFDDVHLTPNKVMQLSLAHERLVNNYLDHLLGEPMHTLWAITTGLCEETALNIDWLRAEIEAVRCTPAARSVQQLGHTIREHLKQDEKRFTLDASQWEAQYVMWCDSLEREDRELIRELKLAIRAGVQTFEQWEHNTIRMGSAQLLRALRKIPAVLTEFHARAAKLVR